nr:hypothetical protein [Mesorhizobium sp. LNHC220B00]
MQILRGAIRLDRMVQQKIPFGGIDILRFLAAVLVMVYHNGFWVWAYPDRISAPATGGLPEQPGIGAWVGSGYRRRDLLRHQRFRHCLQPENSTPLRFFEARVKRLAPAVWICAPSTAALLLLIGLSWPTDAVIRLVRTGLFAPYGPWVDSVYWTLGIEIAFYAIVWILLRLGRFHLMDRLVRLRRDAVAAARAGASWLILRSRRAHLADAVQGGDGVSPGPLPAVPRRGAADRQLRRRP